MVYQNYKKVVDDLVQVVRSQEKQLAEKSTLVADLQKQLENSGNFLLPPFFWQIFVPLC
jgi:hypothetical protein